MPIRKRSFWMLISFLYLFGIAVAQEAIENWPAPASWSLPERVISKGEVTPSDVEAVEAVPTPPLHFVGITPCRLVDTRGNGFTGAYGPPVLTQGVPRNFVLTGRCGISATAQAVSLNVTVTNTQGPGFILIYPQGSAQPTVSTLNYVAGQTVANAAVVPLGTGGGITVIAGVSGADLILDTNGDYRGGVVTGLNGLSGNVTLAEGSNITITPSGQTLTVAATGGPGGVLPAGGFAQTLRHNGSNWVTSSALMNDGEDVTVSGNLILPATFAIGAGDFLFLHNVPGPGGANTYVGQSAGVQPTPGNANTGVGFNALFAAFSGSSNNVALGANALKIVTTGDGNVAIGSDVGTSLTTGSNNLYIASLPNGNESGQIRIGRNDLHTQGTVIASIFNFGSSGGIPVIVNSGGRLGTNQSSIRYKENVRDIGPESDGLMSLRPVVFKYKKEHEPGGLTQYGLIAEEVAEIYPELVVYDDEGRPQAIRSQLLDPLLLNELQKQRREIEDLKARLQKLEGKSAS